MQWCHSKVLIVRVAVRYKGGQVVPPGSEAIAAEVQKIKAEIPKLSE